MRDTLCLNMNANDSTVVVPGRCGGWIFDSEWWDECVATLITMTLIVFALTTPDSLPTKRTGCSSVVHPNERFIETAHVRQLVFTRSVYILTIPHVLERSSSGFVTKVFYTFRHWDHDACSMSALIPTVCYLNTWSGHIDIVARSSLWLNISSLAT